MELHELTARELNAKIAAKEITAAEAAEATFARIEQVEDAVGSYVSLMRDKALAQAEAVDAKVAAGEAIGPLAGVPIGLKDVLTTKNHTTTCCSKILENWVPPYDATVVERCDDAGLLFLGKTNMDEFAMGSSTENSAFQITHNPWDLDRVPGGSSGGSAAAVAAGEATVALGSDTGGSIRQPASLCGCVGLKPTYGRVSRYGLIAYASSLDQIGPLTRDVYDCALVMNVIAGKDAMDATSADIEAPDYTAQLNGDVKGMRAGVVKELLGEGIEAPVRECILAAVEKLEELGVACEEVSLPHSEHALPVYYIIAPAECSSNLARFDGVRYGYRCDPPYENVVDLFSRTRAEGFGPEVRLRIMLGTYALSAGYYDAYYMKALKVRTLIKGDFDRAFEQYDFLVSPTSPVLPFKIGERSDDQVAMKLADVCTIPVNIAGIPGISVPCGFADGLPVGMQLMGQPFGEETLLRAAYAYEQTAGWAGKWPELP